MALAVTLSFQLIALFGLGGLINTGCQKFSNMTYYEQTETNWTFSGKNELARARFEKMKTHEKNWVVRDGAVHLKNESSFGFLNPQDRIDLEDKLNDEHFFDFFTNVVGVCGKKKDIEDRKFLGEIFDQILENKVQFVQWWNENHEKLEIKNDWQSQLSLNKAYRDLEKYHSQFEKGTFSKNVEGSQELQENLKMVSYVLTSFTDYVTSVKSKIKQSMQNTKGKCKVSKDQWVLHPNHCYTAKNYRKRNWNITDSEFSQGNIDSHTTCFLLPEWESPMIEERYTNMNYSSCQDITIGEDEEAHNVTFLAHTMEHIQKASTFFNQLNSSLNSSISYLNTTFFSYNEVQEKVAHLNQSFSEEDKLVKKMSNSIREFNQSNNCNFVNDSMTYFLNEFCYQEKKFMDDYYQTLSMVGTMVLILAVLLGCLGCGFYRQSEEEDTDFVRLEMESFVSSGWTKSKKVQREMVFKDDDLEVIDVDG
jgi:hypothetical protein